jgi:hypothetical protein
VHTLPINPRPSPPHGRRPVARRICHVVRDHERRPGRSWARRVDGTQAAHLGVGVGGGGRVGEGVVVVGEGGARGGRIEGFKGEEEDRRDAKNRADFLFLDFF